MNTNTSTSALNVNVNENYRLTTDATEKSPATQFILQRRHVVDPTRAPGYTPPADGSTPKMSVEWRNDKYYPLTGGGMSAAIEQAVLRGTGVSQAKTIGEALRMYREEAQRIADSVNDCLSPNISVDLGASGLRKG